MKIIGTLLILYFVFCISTVDAQKRKIYESNEIQTQPAKFPSSCDGGILNGIAISLPKPAYPQEAKSVDAKGTVNVQVKIDEKGNVIEAKACSGDFRLRDSAVEAAKQAKFKPTSLSGESVKFSGVIVYDFDSENLNNKVNVEVTNENVIAFPCPKPTNGGSPIVEKAGPLLNLYAINLVKPEYPQNLKEKKISGVVNVQVRLDEQGKIISTVAVSGHQELKMYAEEAARKSTFKRFTLCGKPIKFSNLVVYRFTP